MSFTPKSGIPEEYKGREQSWFKHRVLKLYLESWAHKLSSAGMSRQRVRLWYVDCFAGPWESTSSDLRDTSIAIGLNALKEAAEVWRQEGCQIELGAIFVEKKPSSFKRLQEYLNSRKENFQIVALEGEFGGHLSTIESHIKDDPAFLFVDPTGWNGAAMRFIKPLVQKPRRDVLVNLMYDFMNRMKSHPEEELRQQIAEFFECDVPTNLDEEELLDLYRNQLKTVCGLKYAADLVIQYPSAERTFFRLVVGGHHGAVIKLFRDVERKVVGNEAKIVRAEVKYKKKDEGIGQGALFHPAEMECTDVYNEKNKHAIRHISENLPKYLKEKGPKQFGPLKLVLLQKYHLTESDLKALAWELVKAGKIQIESPKPRQKSVKDEDVLRVEK